MIKNNIATSTHFHLEQISSIQEHTKRAESNLNSCTIIVAPPAACTYFNPADLERIVG